MGPYDYGTIEPGQTVLRSLNASGGTGPYTFHLSDDDAPAWASLDPDGTLTLSPPAGDHDEYVFHVFAVDSTGDHSPPARDTVTVRIEAAGPPQTDTPDVLLPAVPEALWTVPMGNSGRLLPTPDGSIATTKCSNRDPDDVDHEFSIQQVTPEGNLAWRRPREGRCSALATDTRGRHYYPYRDSGGGAHIRAVDPGGRVLWTSATLAHPTEFDGGGRPALGANGVVYFIVNGRESQSWLIGASEDDGTIVVDRALDDPQELFAYDAGLILVDRSRRVDYLDYDGTVHRSIPVPDIGAVNDLKLSAGGTGGTLFMAGGNREPFEDYCAFGQGDPGRFTVVKITPSGVAWTWRAPDSNGCERGSAAATPDGGVVVTQWHGYPFGDPGHVAALDEGGDLLWRITIDPTPRGLVFAGSGVVVDTAGTVALPTHEEYPCAADASDTCIRLRVSFLSHTTGASVLPSISATNEEEREINGAGLGPWNDVAIAAGRVYGAASPHVEGDVFLTHAYGLAALAAPGLEQDYDVARRAAVGGGARPAAG